MPEQAPWMDSCVSRKKGAMKRRDRSAAKAGKSLVLAVEFASQCAGGQAGYQENQQGRYDEPCDKQ